MNFNCITVSGGSYSLVAQGKQHIYPSLTTHLYLHSQSKVWTQPLIQNVWKSVIVLVYCIPVLCLWFNFLFVCFVFIVVCFLTYTIKSI